jgi:hypothetical protein
MSDNFVEINTQNPAFLALTGSLLFADMPSFDLSFTDRRTGQAGYLARTLAPVLLAYGFPPEAGEWLEQAGAPGGVLDASLTLSVPETLAGAWLRAPGESDRNFFEVYSRVSVSVQRMMRRWVPFIYFSDPGRYEDVRTAFPLMFYRSTWPCSGRRGELAYDVVSPERPGAAREWTARPFAAEIRRVRQLLIAAGRRDLARYYDPEEAPKILRSIVQQPRYINALLTGDAFFIDQLVHLGLKTRQISERVAADPSKATRDLVCGTADFAALSNRRLRRLYGGQDFTALGDLLLIEATRALAAAIDGDAVISAVLGVCCGDCQHTFVNDGYEQ